MIKQQYKIKRIFCI